MFCQRALLFFFCCTLLLSPLDLSTAFAAGNAPLGSIDYTGASSTLQVSRGLPEYTSISLSAPNVVAETQMLGYDTYQAFGIPGEPFVMEEGFPTVPQVPRLYRIPNTGSVELFISGMDDFELLDGVDVMPLQFEGSDRFGEARAMVYSQDQWYPPNVADMSAPMIMRDFRVVRVVLYPVQVNPVTRQVRVYRNLQAELVANNRPGENELVAPLRVTGSWVPMYRDMIENLDEDALDDATNIPGTYLILCHSANIAREWADSLHNWKRMRGFDVVIDARSNWSVSSMTQAIQSLYASSAQTNSPLEFVALIGDVDWSTYGMPSGGAYGDYDHAFALGNNGDDIEDLGVGRLSGVGSSEMATINAKIMGYERNPWMQTSGGQADTMWFKRGFFYAGVGWSIASNWTAMQWGAQQFRDWTGVDSTYTYWHNGAVDPNLICNYMNSGVSFMLWRGSFAGEWNDVIPGQCNATWRLPINFLVTCYANDYIGGTGDAEAMAKAGTSTQPKGSVASIGTSTGGTTAPPNGAIIGGLMYAMANLNIEHYGHCLNSAKLWLVKLWGPSHSFTNQFTRWNNLMGDPGLSIWTDVPNVMSVTHPTTVNVGTRRISINVTDADNGAPIADAMVVLWKGSETYERFRTDANGHVDMPVAINSAGTIDLAVTKRNHKPYLYSITCVSAAQMVSVSSCPIDDDNAGGTIGNDNDIFNPGETIDLPVWVKNFGNSGTATGVTATLASSNPRVTVITATATFPNLAAGDSAQGTVPFRIQISPQMQHREQVMLTWTVTASSVQTISAIEFDCQAGRPDYVSHLFTGAVNPGTTNQLRVTIRNGGQLPLAGATAQITSLSPFVQVEDGQGSFGDIAVGQQVTNTADQFSISSNPLTFRGHQAPIRMIMSTTNGYVDTVQFNVNIGSALATDPTGPDAYGYYAYDNTDASYETAPVYSYVDISTGLGTDLNINDIGDKTSITQLYSVVRTLPFDFTYYGETYNQVTVCSNGWIAFGAQGFNDNFRNFPIPSLLAPQAMVAPYWDDLKTDGALGVWEYHDAAEHRYIVQWKAQGAFTPTNLNFEVILYDEEFHPTFDGNGQILFQYHTASMGIVGNGEEPHGCTIGIQDRRSTTGLQYAFLQTYMPGAANITANRAILFTTNARMLFGAVQGTVLDAGTNQPMAGVDVTIDGYNYHETTDAQGQYLIDDVLIGTYTVRAHRRAFNDATVADVVVALDSTSTANFSLLHPEFALSIDSLVYALPEQPAQTSFEIQNAGNGPLDYVMTITYAGDGSTDPWDYLAGVNVTQATNDYQIQGVEFAGDQWCVSGAGTGGSCMIYRFTTGGGYTGSIPQPAEGLGWFDMAWDGEYLYGSEQRVAGGQITGMDLAGQVHATIPSPVNPSRAIAYQPDGDHFWVADYTTPIYKIDRAGTVVDQVENTSPTLSITGLAWWDGEPDGFKLLIFCTNGSGTQLWKMHPLSHDRQLVTTLSANPGEHAGGLAITPGWNSTLLVLGGILQGPAGDRLGIYEVSFNTTWINVSPMQTVVPGATEQEVTVLFDPTYLRTDVYRVNLNISSTVLDTTYVLPVVLAVTAAVPDETGRNVPTTYTLHQNYPNPFNPSTEIIFELPRDGIAKLQVYNTLGQHIRTLADGLQQAGVHRLNWDGRDDFGANVAAGVYIYRLEASTHVSAKKMVLLR